MAVEIDQRLREIQREYLDFLDDEVSICVHLYVFIHDYVEPSSRVCNQHCQCQKLCKFMTSNAHFLDLIKLTSKR